MAPRVKTIPELKMELAGKRKQLAGLRATRAKQAAQLAKLDKAIAVLAGKSDAKPKRRKKRKAAKAVTPKKKAAKKAPAKKAVQKRATGKPLMDYLRQVLKAAPEGMRAKHITAAVQKAGYKTFSKDFYGIVAATLRDAKDFKRIKRGVYALK